MNELHVVSLITHLLQAKNSGGIFLPVRSNFSLTSATAPELFEFIPTNIERIHDIRQHAGAGVILIYRWGNVSKVILSIFMIFNGQRIPTKVFVPCRREFFFLIFRSQIFFLSKTLCRFWLFWGRNCLFWKKLPSFQLDGRKT